MCLCACTPSRIRSSIVRAYCLADAASVSSEELVRSFVFLHRSAARPGLHLLRVCAARTGNFPNYRSELFGALTAASSFNGEQTSFGAFFIMQTPA